MKTFLLVIALLPFSFLFAQDAFVGKVIYRFLYVYDTNDNVPPLEVKMGLIFSAKESIYKSFEEESLNNQYERQVNSQEFNGEIELVGYSNSELDNIYINSSVQKDLVYFRHFANQPYLIRTDYPTINWKIDNKKSKNIGKYLCSYATGSYGKRVYHVWFTEELAIPYGPWKLFGLPGLILEAEDDTGEVKFLFESIIETDIEEMESEIPRNAIKTTESKLNTMIDALKNSGPIITESRSSQRADFGIPINKAKVKSISISPSNRFPVKINNPIERK